MARRYTKNKEKLDSLDRKYGGAGTFRLHVLGQLKRSSDRPGRSVSEIASAEGISATTLYKYLARWEAEATTKAPV